MKVKIIGGYHRGKVLDVQDNIMSVYLPEAFQAVFKLEDPEPILTPYINHSYKLYKQFKYINGEVVGYFIPQDWVHHEVERMLMDAIV